MYNSRINYTYKAYRRQTVRTWLGGIDRQTDRQTGERTDGRTDEETDGRTDKQTDRQTLTQHTKPIITFANKRVNLYSSDLFILI